MLGSQLFKSPVLSINKRQKIIIATICISLGLISTQLVDFELRFKFIAGLSIAAYLLSLWALWEGLNPFKAIILMILPIFFTAAVASFYFLLEVRWLTRLPVAALFGINFYLLLLAQNVFNVASIRTIPLYRVASTASFLFTLLSAFFILHVIYALKMLFVWNGIGVGLVSFPLILQSLWSIEMEDRLSSSVVVQSAILSLIMGEFALVLSFWPLSNIIWSLALSSTMYTLLGLTTQFLRGKGQKRVVWEYLGVGVIVFLVTYFFTSWTG